MSLTPKEFKTYTEQVLEMGAKKYGKDTWKRGEHFNEKGNAMSMLRHTLKSLGLSDKRITHILNNINNHITVAGVLKEKPCPSYDDESGLSHTKHIMTRAGMVTYMREHKLGEFK